MRIAQVTPYFSPVEGGVERHVLNLSKGLIGLGNDVEVFTCSGTRDGGTLEPLSFVDGIPVRRYASVASLGEFGKVWPGFTVDLLRGGYDVIHAHSFRHPHTDISLVASKLSGSASVLTTHSPFHPDYVRGPLARALVPLYDDLVAPVSLRSFDRIVSLTNGEAERLEEMGASPEHTVVIPHGIEKVHLAAADPSHFTSKFGLEGRTIILCLARINRTKGLDVLLDAFSRIAHSLPQASLVFAGPCTSRQEEDFLAELLDKTRALGLNGKVVFTGRLSEEAKSSAYEACALFVLPSLYEPYGIVLLEAAAHGKPLVSTTSGGPSSIVSEGINGLLVDPGDAGQLAEALRTIITDAPLRREMGRQARLLARDYTWERVAKATDEVYRGAVGGR